MAIVLQLILLHFIFSFQELVLYLPMRLRFTISKIRFLYWLKRQFKSKPVAKQTNAELYSFIIQEGT